jgi:hypothetical protein
LRYRTLLRVSLSLVLLVTSGLAQTFKNPILIPTALDPAKLGTADFNQDGNPDLAYVDAGDTLHVLLGHGDGTFAESQTVGLPTGICACYINIADVTADGKLDLLIGSGGAVSASVAVFPGNGDGTFGTPIVSTFAASNEYVGVGTRMAVGDVNGDGALDLVVPDGENSLFYVLLEITAATSHLQQLWSTT